MIRGRKSLGATVLGSSGYAAWTLTITPGWNNHSSRLVCTNDIQEKPLYQQVKNIENFETFAKVAPHTANANK